jgi:hypothetical protein
MAIRKHHSLASALMDFLMCVSVYVACVCVACVLGVCVSVYVRLVSSHRLPATFQPKTVKDSLMHRKGCTECGKDDWMEGELYFTDVRLVHACPHRLIYYTYRYSFYVSVLYGRQVHPAWQTLRPTLLPCHHRCILSTSVLYYT